MKKISLILLCLFTLINCKAQEAPTQFSQEALNDTFINIKGKQVTFASILKEHKDKTIIIDVWASWCRDCIKGIPKVAQLQQNNPETAFLFLSLDKTEAAWKRGVAKYNLKGEHYYMQSGWKGPFGTFLDLDWIPRYMVIGKTGEIKVYRAIKADDKIIQEQLN